MITIKDQVVIPEHLLPERLVAHLTKMFVTKNVQPQINGGW